MNKKEITDGLEHLRTRLDFSNFGLFAFNLMMRSMEDQEFIVDKLLRASSSVRASSQISVIEIVEPKVELRGKEFRYRFIVEYQFMCIGCKQIRRRANNLGSELFRSMCYACEESAFSDMDSVANQLYD